MNISEEEKRISDVFATWITIFALTCGGVFGLVQYLHSKEKEEVDRTITFYTSFNAPPILDYRIKLAESYESKYSDIYNTLTAKNKSNDDITHDYELIIINMFNNDKELQKSLFVTMEFLHGVAVCGEKKLCEDSTTRSLFGQYGKSFYRQYYPYIKELRSKWKDTSIGIDFENYFNK